MRVLEHDELTAELETDLQHLRASIGLPPRDFSRLRKATSEGYPAPDYFGLYAVEGGRVLSTVRLLRLPYTFPDGHAEAVSAIMSVMTRADSRGRGLVRWLLEEIHTRERKAGVRFSILWCELSIKAHRLYEYMGYRDVYTPELATKRPSRRKPETSLYELAGARDSDVGRIERIHALATKGRIGFTPRPKGYLRSLIWYGRLSPDSFRMILKGDSPVGYLELEDGPTAVKVSEVVMMPQAPDPAQVLRALEHLCGERWLWLTNTFVSDNRDLLERRGYTVSHLSNQVLMALPLDSSVKGDVSDVLGTRDPRFVYHITDFF